VIGYGVNLPNLHVRESHMRHDMTYTKCGVAVLVRVGWAAEA
jgi:hypothetical protein